MRNLKALTGLIAVVAVITLGVIAIQAKAGSDRYVFLVRAIVNSVDHTNQTVDAYATYTSSLAKNDLAGNVVKYNVRPAKFYEWENGVKRVKTFTKALPSGETGQEVVMRGAAKTTGNYNVAWLVVNDRTFTIVGKLKDNDLTRKKLKILVGTSTYKQSTFANKEIVVNYKNSTIFKNQGKDIDADDVPASSQLIKVVGEIKDSNWEVTHVFDNV